MGDIGSHWCDSMLKPTDFSWRLEPERAAPARPLATSDRTGAISSQHVAGQRIVEVLADLATVVRHPTQAVGVARGVRASAATRARAVHGQERRPCHGPRAIRGRRQGLRVGRTGVRGPQERSVVRGERPARRRVRWRQEAAERVVDWPPRHGERRAGEGSVLLAPAARAYAHLPGGHQEGWADAFCNVMRDIYGFIAAGRSARHDARPPAFATFEDGYPACVVDAMLESHRRGGVWTKVAHSDRSDSMKLGLFTPVFGKLMTRRDAREGAGARQDAGARTWHRRLAGQRPPRPRRAARATRRRARRTAR